MSRLAVNQLSYKHNGSLSDSLDFDCARKIVPCAPARRAAVSLMFDSDEIANASVLMMQRAKHEGDPWSGQMAFPGGRQEKFDRNTLETAKRETYEEVGFNIESRSHRMSNGHLIGRLSDISLMHLGMPINLIVTPYVFNLDQRPDLMANYEVADLVWIPLERFADFSQRKRFTYRRGNFAMERPCYQLADEKLVWGLSLSMIDELLVRLGLPAALDAFA